MAHSSLYENNGFKCNRQTREAGTQLQAELRADSGGGNETYGSAGSEIRKNPSYWKQGSRAQERDEISNCHPVKRPPPRTSSRKIPCRKKHEV